MPAHVTAPVIALIVSALVRRNARKIAEADRSSELSRAHFLFELEALTRLSENLDSGGLSDKAGSTQMGAKALTLVGLLSRERLPGFWKRKVGSDDQLRAACAEPDMPQHKKEALDTQLAISAELR